MNKKTWIKKGISLLLALAMVVTTFAVMPTEVQAASSSYVYEWDREIGINGTIKVSEYLDKRSGATYSFSSSKTAVAKVSSKGKITGVKAGKTTIKVTEKYKGKKKVIGKFIVQVRKAYICDDYYPLVNQTGYYENNKFTYDYKWDIMCRNPKATYKVYAADKSKITISTKGVITALNAKDGETVKVVIKETYKGKTRKVGTRSFEVIEPYAENEETWYVGDYYYTPMNYYYDAWVAWVEDEPLTDDEILEDTAEINSPDHEGSLGDGDGILKADKDEDGSLYFYTQKTGTVYFYIYLLNYNTQTYEYIGHPVKVNVIEDSYDYDYDSDWDDYYYDS